MAKSPDDALKTMIGNMPEKTGKSLEQWFKVIKANKLSGHTEILEMLKDKHGVSYGFANTIAILYRQQAAGGAPSREDLVAAQYAGAKAGLKPLYDDIIKAVKKFGGDVEVAPKKANVSLRRNKQFALIQPSTKDRMDIGLNLRGIPVKGRLQDSGSFGGMCTHRVSLSTKAEFDEEVLNWLRQAYEQA
jgi:hypothetical protein